MPKNRTIDMGRPIGVVLSDVDGTQIIHGQKVPSPEVQAVAHDLRTRGVSLLEVTGRSHALMRKLVVPLDLRNNLCTLDGGATVAHAASGEVVWSRWLSSEATRSVVTGIGRLCTGIHFDTASRGRSTQEVLEMVQTESATIEGTPSVFAIFHRKQGEEIVSVLGSIANIQSTAIMDYEDSDTLRCIQVVSQGVDKQFGIQQMLHHGGLADYRRLAIGDGMNDLSLFAAIGEDGVRVAMGNAPDQLKELADWVAPHVQEHGFAVAMERYCLAA